MAEPAVPRRWGDRARPSRLRLERLRVDGLDVLDAPRTQKGHGFELVTGGAAVLRGPVAVRAGHANRVGTFRRRVGGKARRGHARTATSAMKGTPTTAYTLPSV